MSPPAVQFIPAARRVERRALFTIKKCVDALKLQKVPVPVPVENWIERPLGLKLGFGDLTRDGKSHLGAINFEAREITVSELIEHPGRIRFTAAHELGHWVLHSKLGGVHLEDTERESAAVQRVEREADRFAAAFLIPLPVLAAFFPWACGLAGTTPLAALDGLRAEDRAMVELWRGQILPRLANRFDVSLAAMANRFADLKNADNEPIVPRFCLSALSIVGAGARSWMTS
jgi:Zn-dependent peptidase ImmA (M78 family)